MSFPELPHIPLNEMGIPYVSSLWYHNDHSSPSEASAVPDNEGTATPTSDSISDKMVVMAIDFQVILVFRNANTLMICPQ